MHFRDSIIEMTKYATNALFRTARAVPDDKLEWKPLDEGRSVKEQLQECAYTPLYFMGLISPPKDDATDNAQGEAATAETPWSIDVCEAECHANSERLYKLISTLTDEQLQEMVELPWSEKASKAQVAGLQYWNLVYHQGQISYIQTLYGDVEFH